MIEPRGFERWNRAHRGAYRKGWRAGKDGEPEAPPYDDKRKASGRLSWSRSFIRAWCDGWRAGDEQRKQDLITAYYSEKARSGQPQPMPR